MKRESILLLQSLLFFAAETIPASQPDQEVLTLQNNTWQQKTNEVEMLRDIHGPLPTSEYPPYLVEAAIALLCLLLLALFIFALKRRKKSQPPSIPPWDTALQELAEARRLMQHGDSLLYLDQAAQILRRYIEIRFSIRSTRQTTREFFAGLKASGHSALVRYRVELRACLEQADMAKFAHLPADQNHMEQMEDAVRAFVCSTRPEMEPQGERK